MQTNYISQTYLREIIMLVILTETFLYEKG